MRGVKSDLPYGVQVEIDRIRRIPSAQRSTADAAYIAARADYLDSSEEWNVPYVVEAEGEINPEALETAKGEAVAEVIRYTTVEVSTAELLALYTTAKAIVAAPGAGKFIEVINALLTFDYAAAFTPGSATTLALAYKDKTGAVITGTRAVTGFLDQTSDQVSLLRPLTTSLAIDSNVVDKPVCLTLAGANPTGGSGSKLYVKVAYRVVTLS